VYLLPKLFFVQLLKQNNALYTSMKLVLAPWTLY